MTILLLPVLVGGAIVAWAAGAQTRHILLGLLAGAVVLLGATVAIVGVESAMDDDDPDDSPSAVSVRTIDERLEVATDDGRFANPIRPIAGLTDGEGRLVEVTGLGEGASVRARQCTADERRCAAAIPVQADDDGGARFLFEFAASVQDGSDDPASDCRQAPCVLVVQTDDDERLVSAGLLFADGASGGGASGGGASGGELRVERPRGLRVGDSLAVSLSGFAPGPVTVTLCTPPGPVDASTCGAPAPEVEATVHADGTADVELTAYMGDVGEHGARCGRGHRCAVAVKGRPDVRVVTIGFAGSADARPSATQVIIGLSLAAVLASAAAVAARRGPWTPPDGDPFAGVTIEDPFAGLDLTDDDDDQPATSRRANDTVAAVTRTPT